jgi:hypothetical protein
MLEIEQNLEQQARKRLAFWVGKEYCLGRGGCDGANGCGWAGGGNYQIQELFIASKTIQGSVLL